VHEGGWKLVTEEPCLSGISASPSTDFSCTCDARAKPLLLPAGLKGRRVTDLKRRCLGICRRLVTRLPHEHLERGEVLQLRLVVRRLLRVQCSCRRGSGSEGQSRDSKKGQ
jgi:hypothetical protein